MLSMYPVSDVPADFHGGDRSHAPYSSMNEKSEAASRRERLAIELFDSLRSQGTPTTKTRRLFLEPSCHLTGACWSTFSKHVRSFPGWMAKRRVATPEEKLASKVKRKGKVYFVDVIHDPAKAVRALAKQASEEIIKRTTMDATPLQPEAKKAEILLDSSNKQQEHAATPLVTP